MGTTSNCPQCGSGRMYRSRRRSFRERLLTSFGCAMQRCHECNRRYASFGSSMMKVEDLRRIGRKIGLALTMAAAAVILLGVVLWFSRAQAAAASDARSLAPARQASVEMLSGV